jgi:hypothetical protein
MVSWRIFAAAFAAIATPTSNIRFIESTTLGA